MKYFLRFTFLHKKEKNIILLKLFRLFSFKIELIPHRCCTLINFSSSNIHEFILWNLLFWKFTTKWIERYMCLIKNNKVTLQLKHFFIVSAWWPIMVLCIYVYSRVPNKQTRDHSLKRIVNGWTWVLCYICLSSFI